MAEMDYSKASPFSFREGKYLEFSTDLANQQAKARGAITISWDDGYERSYRVLLPILQNEFPLQRHTFAITSSFVDSNNSTFLTSKQVKEIYDAGHEIANHSYSHKNIGAVTLAERIQEYDESNVFLENLIQDKVTTFVYPLGQLGRTSTTDIELYGRYDRIVNAGMTGGGSMSPMDNRTGQFIVPRSAVWDSTTHQEVLDLIRQTAFMPVILNLYAHRAGDGPTGGTSGGGAADVSVAQIREGLNLIEALNIPVVTIKDAFPGSKMVGNFGAELGTAGWNIVDSVGNKTFTSVTDTPSLGLNGTKSFKLTSPTSAGFIYAYRDIPVIEGKSYSYTVRAKRLATVVAGTSAIRIQAKDQFGNGVGGVGQADATLADGTWGLVATAPMVAPVGAVSMRIDMILNAHQGEMNVDHIHFGPTTHGSFG